ncbi:MAG: hydroxymethylbilane synthase [Alphaproteobacteria bacterium]|nr:hydroxymethylbilane synthase [Alphaproteobacteria bacterium]
MTATPAIRIGTRGSQLALVQTEQVRAALAAAHPELAAEGAIEIEIIRTTGDRVTDRPLAEIGGKGLFAKEIEAALLDRRIDLAVHSMKDVETWLPDGLAITVMLPREDPRDALISKQARTIDDLPRGAVVGTASLRRRAQLLARRPDLDIVLIRGNVPTRLEKLERGDVDATILALAGLQRLGLADAPAAVLAPEEMLPAVGQGAIGIEHRVGDARIDDLVAVIGDAEALLRVTAERAMLAVLDGSCRTPIAGLAECDGDTLRLGGLIARPDGSAVYRAAASGPAGDPEGLGRDVADRLLAQSGADFLTGMA